MLKRGSSRDLCENTTELPATRSPVTHKPARSDAEVPLAVAGGRGDWVEMAKTPVFWMKKRDHPF